MYTQISVYHGNLYLPREHSLVEQVVLELPKDAPGTFVYFNNIFTSLLNSYYQPDVVTGTTR